MDAGWVVLNLAYLIYTASGLFKDMIRLRVTLLGATLLFILYGLVADIWSIFWWNLPVALVHGAQIGQLIRQRRGINLDAEAEAIRLLLYPTLSRVDFNRWWHASQERIVNDDVLIVKGAPVDELILILTGELEVDLEPPDTPSADTDAATPNGRLVQLGRLRFVGEISRVANTHATATVRAVGQARLRCWPNAMIDALCAENGEIERAHLTAIGQELTRKLT